MSEFRKDPILERWVIVATNRSQRPGAFIESQPFDPTLPCPFCRGHEDETPQEVLALRDGKSASDWRVRVVPNKFPCLNLPSTSSEQQAGEEGPLRPSGITYERIDGFGAHEVIVESPRHVFSTSDLTLEELTDVFRAYKMRLARWQADGRMAYGQIFKNAGQAAGASLEHAHSQLLVTPMVPIGIANELAGAQEYYRQRDRCVFCDMICAEIGEGSRLVVETAHHIAFAPFAARLPFETWVLPKRHASHYEQIEETSLGDLAGILRELICRLEAAAGRCAYNYILHTAPLGTSAAAHYHWHIEIVPNLARTAGFELATGYYINPIAPEVAAERMRNVPESRTAE